MFQNSVPKIIIFILLIGLILPSQSSYSQTNSAFLIEDFEITDFSNTWWSFSNSDSFKCEHASPGFTSEHALQLSFELTGEQYAGCGKTIDHAQRWIDTTGLRLHGYSSVPNLWLTVAVDMTDLTQTNPETEGVTQFEITYPISSPDWTQVVLPWEQFMKAEWIGSSGVDKLDVTRIESILVSVSDGQNGSVWIDDIEVVHPRTPPNYSNTFDEYALWTNGTQLRGANIWQRIVVPEIDGNLFLGNGHVGPPYVQADFDWMAALGANYVNISHPGLFTEQPPYVLDEAVQANLDALLAMIANADMFAVISFRTGPGRSDFTFYDDDIEEWGDSALVIEHVWTDEAAQDAWVEMWRYTAEHYRDNSIVVGYDLMVEPNSAGRLLEIWEPNEFYPEYAGTTYDWNQFYPRLVEAIREVDTQTPVLVSAMGWGAVPWLPYLQPIADERIVYTVHQYEPHGQYTHQAYPAEVGYPDTVDLDWDEEPDSFNRDWLNEYLSPIDDFQAQYDVPVAVNEYGLVRWAPNAAEFMRDEMALFEARGLNHAFWMFGPGWQPHAEGNDAFDYWHGSDPANHSNIENSDVVEVILENWSQNTLRPSNIAPNQ